MPSVDVREAQERDVWDMAPRLRDADREECEAWGASPAEALRDSKEASPIAWTAEVDGVAAAMFGVARRSLVDNVGIVWLLTTPEIERVPVTFRRTAQAFIAAELPRWGLLEAYVDHRYRRAVDFCLGLGGAIDETREVNGVLFYIVRWRR